MIVLLTVDMEFDFVLFGIDIIFKIRPGYKKDQNNEKNVIFLC